MASPIRLQDSALPMSPTACSASTTASTPAGEAQMSENAAAAIADFVVVDMYANYCTGREDVKTAMSSAERAAKRIFRA